MVVSIPGYCLTTSAVLTAYALRRSGSYAQQIKGATETLGADLSDLCTSQDGGRILSNLKLADKSPSGCAIWLDQPDSREVLAIWFSRAQKNFKTERKSLIEEFLSKVTL